MWGFDVVTEQDQGDEQVVNVGFVNREEDHGHILLQRQDIEHFIDEGWQMEQMEFEISEKKKDYGFVQAKFFFR